MSDVKCFIENRTQNASTRNGAQVSSSMMPGLTGQTEKASQARPASSIIYREARMDFYQASPPENSEKFVFGCTASLRIGNKMRPHKMRLKYHHQWCQDWLARQRRPARPGKPVALYTGTSEWFFIRSASQNLLNWVEMLHWESDTKCIHMKWGSNIIINDARDDLPE